MSIDVYDVPPDNLHQFGIHVKLIFYLLNRKLHLPGQLFLILFSSSSGSSKKLEEWDRFRRRLWLRPDVAENIFNLVRSLPASPTWCPRLLIQDARNYGLALSASLSLPLSLSLYLSGTREKVIIFDWTSLRIYLLTFKNDPSEKVLM